MGNKIKNIKSSKNIKLDLERYVNTDTGELLSSEIKQELNYKITSEGNYVIITSDDFVVLDSKTVRYLSTELSRTEMQDRKSTRLNSSHVSESRMPSSA